jgi:hypothetical protein
LAILGRIFGAATPPGALVLLLTDMVVLKKKSFEFVESMVQTVSAMKK